MSNAVVEAPVVTRVAKLGSVEQIPLGQGLCFVVGDEEIAVFRQRNGRVFATQNRCPHKGAPLSEGIVGDGKVICPFHARKFDLCTGHGSEAHECVKTYEVRVENGEITLIL